MGNVPQLTGLYAEGYIDSAMRDLLRKIHERIDPPGLKLGSITSLQHIAYDENFPRDQEFGLLVVSQTPYPFQGLPEGTVIDLIIAYIPERCKFNALERV